MYARLVAMAAVASAACAPLGANSSAGSEKLLMSGSGHIMIGSFDAQAKSLKIDLDKTVSGAPTWLALAKPNLLYAVDENSDTTSLFNVDLEAKKLDLKTSVKGSTGVVHLELARDGSRMLGAAYGSSAIDVYDTSSGGLKFVKAVPSNDSLGPVKERQEKPHPHQAVLDPSGRFFAVNDLGTDRILVVDSKDDSFQVVNHVPVSPAGCGPRHGAFLPAGASASQATHYLVLCEIKNVVNVFSLRYGGAKGIDFFLEQTISTFPSATPAKAAAGELAISPDSKDVYVSNRLTGAATDNIAHFRIAKPPSDNGALLKLELVASTSTGGTLPRMFSFSRDGKTLFVGNTGKGDLAVVALQRNADGTLVEKPVASIASSAFPGGVGPAYIQPVA